VTAAICLMHQSTKRQSNPIEIVSENPNRTNSDPTANKFRPEKNRPLRVNRQTKNGFDKTPTDGVGEGWCRRREGRTDHHKTEATSEEGKFGFWVVEVEESRWLCSREKSVVFHSEKSVSFQNVFSSHQNYT
jgi:hypothetical protein